MRPKIYIAGPMSHGDFWANIRNGLDAWYAIFQLGAHPICPMWDMMQQIVHPIGYNSILEYDMECVLSCDAVLRMPGYSPGADSETRVAAMNGVPVLYSITEVQELFQERLKPYGQSEG